MTALDRTRGLDEDAIRPRPRLVTAGSATASARERESDTVELMIGFGQLTLIYKSLLAVITLGALPPQDELLNDTIQLVDQALERAL